MAVEEFEIPQERIPDGVGNGIQKYEFSLSSEDGNVRFIANCNPDYGVIDCVPEYYPCFEGRMTVQDFKSLCKMFLRFDERIS